MENKHYSGRAKVLCKPNPWHLPLATISISPQNLHSSKVYKNELKRCVVRNMWVHLASGNTLAWFFHALSNLFSQDSASYLQILQGQSKWNSVLHTTELPAREDHEIIYIKFRLVELPRGRTGKPILTMSALPCHIFHDLNHWVSEAHNYMPDRSILMKKNWTVNCIKVFGTIVCCTKMS